MAPNTRQSASPRKVVGHEVKRDSNNGFLQKTLNTSRFSDLQIQTTEETFKVHKMILCGQSDFFDRMFQRQWKETTDNVVILKDDDPEAIKEMIQYMYGFDYRSAHKPNLPTVFLHLKVYQVAVKYGAHDLEKDALQAFAGAINKIGIVGNFMGLVPEVYGRTTTGDQELRNALVDVSYREAKALMKMGGFGDILECNPDYALDLLKKYMTESTK